VGCGLSVCRFALLTLRLVAFSSFQDGFEIVECQEQEECILEREIEEIEGSHR